MSAASEDPIVLDFDTNFNTAQEIGADVAGFDMEQYSKSSMWLQLICELLVEKVDLASLDDDSECALCSWSAKDLSTLDIMRPACGVCNHNEQQGFSRIIACHCNAIYCSKTLEAYLRWQRFICTICKHSGLLDSIDFPHHQDYITPEAAELIRRGYFEVEEGYPRFPAQEWLAPASVEVCRGRFHLQSLVSFTDRSRSLLRALPQIKSSSLRP
jgi:hypothetical protein